MSKLLNGCLTLSYMLEAGILIFAIYEMCLRSGTLATLAYTLLICFSFNNISKFIRKDKKNE